MSRRSWDPAAPDRSTNFSPTAFDVSSMLVSQGADEIMKLCGPGVYCNRSSRPSASPPSPSASTIRPSGAARSRPSVPFKMVSPGLLHRASLSFSTPQVQATPFCPLLQRILLLPSASGRRLSLARGGRCVQKPSRFCPPCPANLNKRDLLPAQLASQMPLVRPELAGRLGNGGGAVCKQFTSVRSTCRASAAPAATILRQRC